MRGLGYIALSVIFTALCGAAFGQDPNLADRNLAVSREVFSKNHLIARVSLRVAYDKFVR